MKWIIGIVLVLMEISCQNAINTEKKSAKIDKIVLEEGEWKADDGKIYLGGKTSEIEVPFDRLPYFIKTN